MNLGKLRQTPNAPLFGGEGGLVDPVSPARALFNEILARYANAPDDLAIMPSTIVSEVELPALLNVQDIVWNLRADQANPSNPIRTTEVRLQTRDAFVIDRIGLFFGVQVSGDPASAVYYQQYDNPHTVANSGFSTTGAQAVRQAYNGSLYSIVNTVQYIAGVHASQFRYVDTAQASTAVLRSAQENSFGYVDLTPAMTVRGSDSSQFTLRIPDPALFSTGGDEIIIARLMLRGMLVQGGAQFEL